MKARGFTHPTVLSGLALLACLQAHADPAMTDITTPEQMAAKMRASQAARPLPGEPVTGETRVIHKAPEGIFETSQILSANGQWTLVPKGALVYVPAALQSRVNAPQEGTLVPLQDFLAANRQWVSSQEVSIAQAAGQEGIKPETAKFWASQNKIVVATHQGGAISFKTPTAAKP
ncbi:hypothetical protein [Luteolibacter sp. LG18]|uniref:hypothetical protein n=1 Tax=Luteolibacter sp. LG18 TaxID=2819286 RepID=UPI002B2806F1|nr:hypothetical protein llg_32220 [Luteolibacter sp. LG18]